MHIIAKIALGTLVPRIINEVYTFVTNNKEQLFIIPKQKIKDKFKRKPTIEKLFSTISKSGYISINGHQYKISGYINEEEEQLLHLDGEITYNLQSPDDLQVIKEATFYKLKKV
jgi:hypothetical protein